MSQCIHSACIAHNAFVGRVASLALVTWVCSSTVKAQDHMCFGAFFHCTCMISIKHGVLVCVAAAYVLFVVMWGIWKPLNVHLCCTTLLCWRWTGICWNFSASSVQMCAEWWVMSWALPWSAVRCVANFAYLLWILHTRLCMYQFSGSVYHQVGTWSQAQVSKDIFSFVSGLPRIMFAVWCLTLSLHRPCLRKNWCMVKHAR